MSTHFLDKKRFRFEVFWTKLEGSEDAIKEAWQCDNDIVDLFKRLDALFQNTMTFLQAWGQHKAGNIKIFMEVENWVIFRFDHTQEVRLLSGQELWLRRSLKLALLGMASFERTIKRQHSRIKLLKEGDANTKLFQGVANGSRSKSFIPKVRRGTEILTEESNIEDVFYEAYGNLLGKASARDHTTDLQYIGMTQLDLIELDAIFTEKEVWQTMKETPSDRAPGPDGFIGLLYHKARPVIKHNIMVVFLKMFVEDGRGFGKLNEAHTMLIPKTPEALEVGDFRPISLPHNLLKLFTNVLALRARKRMHEIVSTNESTFIKSKHSRHLFVGSSSGM
ncbi:hypothetical protein D1007_43285 [Hordeum vulgare]|nr:hypothetical protein D1007_62325 [Hordeum vulgare]KAE8783247.1 hypothetical protein D1007_43285 [Hordeum vulgare]